MSLSPETSLRLEIARNNEASYRPTPEIQKELGSRSLLMVVAPAAMGKTCLMNAVKNIDDRFGMSATVSTRKPRNDDMPGLFRLLEHNDETINNLLDKVNNGEMVQYAIHPSELTFYGSEIADHPHNYNMLATLSGGVDQLKQVGFATTNVIGLVAPPADWSKWFNERYPTSDPNRIKRLIEADRSYADLLAREDVTWIVNHKGDIEMAAKSMIDAVHGTHQPDDEALAYIHRIRQLIADATRLASYTKDYE